VLSFAVFCDFPQEAKSTVIARNNRYFFILKKQLKINFAKIIFYFPISKFSNGNYYFIILNA
jgi:hypothetical protein